MPHTELELDPVFYERFRREQEIGLSNTCHEVCVDTYFRVITWQIAPLQDERTDIEITQRRFEVSLLLATLSVASEIQQNCRDDPEKETTIASENLS